jgi:hypothetical protein
MTKQTESGPKTVFVDNPNLPETFADSFGQLSFDGQVMKIELRTTRNGEVKPPNPPDRIQYPVCHLVLTPSASIKLYDSLKVMMEQLEKAGIFKKIESIRSDITH